MTRNTRSSITHWLRLPNMCSLCDHFHRDSQAVCLSCQHMLLPLGHACNLCAIPLPDNNALICKACHEKPPAFERMLTAYQFVEPLRSLLHAYKYEKALYLGSFLASLMVKALPSGYQTDCLMPVPIHPHRLRQRGFNQALELARYIAHDYHWPLSIFDCYKKKNTPSQAALAAKERKSNLKNSFHIRKINYRHVTLVDDLLTTGSTANEIAVLLKRQGVTRVDVLCCARTPSFINEGATRLPSP